MESDLQGSAEQHASGSLVINANAEGNSSGEIFDRSAYKTNGKRVALLLVANIQMILVSGIVMGWQPLEEAMMDQGAFRYLCAEGEDSCNRQNLRLNMVYLIGTFMSTGSAFFSGYVFDRWGPRLTNIIAYVMIMLGCFTWFIASRADDNLYILSFAMIGIGGPACQVSLLHIANLFPSISNSISSLFSGAFVLSSLVFKIFSIIAEKYSVSIHAIFLYYMIVVTAIFIPSFILMSKKAFIPWEEMDRLEQQARQKDQPQAIDEEQPSRAHKQPLDSFKDLSALKQCLSWQFIFLVLFMSLNSLHEVYYIGVVNDLFESDFYLDFFNYSWNFGIVFVPLVGYIMVKSSLHLNSLLLLSTGFVFGVVFSIHVDKIQPIGFVFISLQNVYLWSFFFVYLAEIFGYSNYGKLMGISSIITALIGLLEYLLVYLTLNVLNFFWVNLILTISKLPLLYLPYKLWATYSRRNPYTRLPQENQP